MEDRLGRLRIVLGDVSRDPRYPSTPVWGDSRSLLQIQVLFVHGTIVLTETWTKQRFYYVPVFLVYTSVYMFDINVPSQVDS